MGEVIRTISLNVVHLAEIMASMSLCGMTKETYEEALEFLRKKA